MVGDKEPHETLVIYLSCLFAMKWTIHTPCKI